MGGRKLLELIWQGTVKPSKGARATRLAGLLTELLPVNTVCLTAACDLAETRVLTDETELEPALPIGDVLAEEMGLDVPYGTLVVIENARGRATAWDMTALSRQLGEIVGETLLGVIRRGVFPFEDEATALFVMGGSYHRMALSKALMDQGLETEPFRAGLSRSLAQYWSGASFLNGEAAEGIFESPALRNHLREGGRGAKAFDPSYARASLLHFESGPYGYEKWLAMVKRAVLAEIEGLGQHAHDGDILR